MDVSIFLAKVFSLYLVIFSIILFCNKEKITAASKQLVSNDGMLFFLGAFTLILGILLIVAHNVWVADWRIAITILCWITFTSGVVRTAFPTLVQRSVTVFDNNVFYYSVVSVMFLLGLYLGYHGFM